MRKVAKSFCDRNTLTYKEAVQGMKKNKSLTREISKARKFHRLGEYK